MAPVDRLWITLFLLALALPLLWFLCNRCACGFLVGELELNKPLNRSGVSAHNPASIDKHRWGACNLNCLGVTHASGNRSGGFGRSYARLERGLIQPGLSCEI